MKRLKNLLMVVPVMLLIISIAGCDDGGSSKKSDTLLMDILTSSTVNVTVTQATMDGAGVFDMFGWSGSVTIPADSDGGDPNEYVTDIPFQNTGSFEATWEYVGGTPAEQHNCFDLADAGHYNVIFNNSTSPYVTVELQGSSDPLTPVACE